MELRAGLHEEIEDAEGDRDLGRLCLWVGVARHGERSDELRGQPEGRERDLVHRDGADHEGHQRNHPERDGAPGLGCG